MAEISIAPAYPSRPVIGLWLQGLTLTWLIVELAVSTYAAFTAHSPVMVAFGSDSLVEVLSASLVVSQWTPRFSISERAVTRTASLLLFILAGVVGIIAVGSLVLKIRPQSSRAGIAITAATLVVMSILAFLKRREAHHSGNKALAADAVQSGACAYLAGIALVGLASESVFHLPWFDPLAALVALPFLFKEGREAWQGKSCNCV